MSEKAFMRIFLLVFILSGMSCFGIQEVYAWPPDDFQVRHEIPSVAQNQMQEQLNDQVIVGRISFFGNKKTKRSILLRELLISEGDTLLLGELQQRIETSRNNLINTQLFNFVEIETDLSFSPVIYVRFAFVERWYTWPIPVFEIKERNLSDWFETPRISRVNYGLSVNLGNFSGQNEKLTLLLKAGYKHNYSLTYQSPYFNRSQTLSWGVVAGMEMSRESVYMTQNNQQLFYKGSHFVFRRQFGQASLTFRPGLFSRHRIHAGLHQYSYADTLTVLNPRFVPGDRSRFYFVNAGYEYNFDKRDAKAYPLHGWFISASIHKFGLGFMELERVDATVLQASLRSYQELAPRWYASAAINLKWSEGSTQSYFNQQGLGFSSDQVRGYENYVIDAQTFMVLKTNLKFELIPQKNTHLRFIPTEKFSRIHYALFLNFFIDAGYAADKYFYYQNPLNNMLLAGAGLGLDFVTYYDKVLRLDASINRRGETGFFLHMIAPF